MVLNVNGVERRVDAPADEPLLTVLRDWLDLRGTKYGCGEGHCGACTVLVDGTAVRSCQTRASLAAGKRIRTIEDISRGDRLHPVQRAFLDEEAFQCGYCTPGMIMAAVALLGARATPSRQEIVKGMQRNICRCGTYPRIVAAVERAAAAASSNSQAARGDQDEAPDHSQGGPEDHGAVADLTMKETSGLADLPVNEGPSLPNLLVRPQ